MKNNIILSILFLFISAVSYSQTLPNMDFDNWTSFSGGAYEEPSGGVWTTANKATLLSSTIFPVTTEKTTDVISGTYAARITTKLAGTTPPLLMSGTLATGVFNELALPPANLKLGTPFTGRPLRFTGYYKYIDNTGDSCDIYAILSKWDGSTHQTIGDARMRSTLTVTEYTKFDITFTYYSPDTPDSISVVFASSAGGAQMQGNAGSTLYVDNTALEYTNGYEVLLNPDILVSCYPIPSANSLNFSMNKEIKNGVITIYTETGTEVISMKIINKYFTISIDKLQAGNYFYKVADNNITLNTGRFIIE